MAVVPEPVLIDLDSPAPPAAGPGRPWPRLRDRSRVLAVALVAVTLMVLVADAGRPVDTARTLSVAGTPLDAIGDTLYTGGANGTRLNAYSLRTGDRRWTAVMPALANVQLVPAGSRLLLTSWEQQRTVALDVRTGRLGWQHSGLVVWRSPDAGRLALLAQGGPGEDAADRSFSVAMVSSATGAGDVRYARPALVSPVYPVDDRSNDLAGVFVRTGGAGGEVFDFATEAVRPLAVPLPAPPTSPPLYGPRDRPQYEALVLTRGTVLDFAAWGEQVMVAGFGGTPLRQRWSVPNVTIGSAWTCGVALCSADGAQAYAVDPVTGEVRWRAVWGLLWPAAGGRAYLARGYVGGADGLAVVDGTTGRELLRRDAWLPVGTLPGARLPVLSYEYGDGRARLAVLDAERLTTRQLAVLPSGEPLCRASGTYVTCRLAAGTYGAWRYTG